MRHTYILKDARPTVVGHELLVFAQDSCRLSHAAGWIATEVVRQCWSRPSSLAASSLRRP